jgi:hypothetical protein
MTTVLCLMPPNPAFWILGETRRGGGEVGRTGEERRRRSGENR